MTLAVDAVGRGSSGFPPPRPPGFDIYARPGLNLHILGSEVRPGPLSPWIFLQPQPIPLRLLRQDEPNISTLALSRYC